MAASSSSSPSSAEPIVHRVLATERARPMGQKDDPWIDLAASALAIDPATFRQFIEAMALSGDPIDPARMYLDPVYSFRRLADAHTSRNERLRDLSLQLFEPCQRLQERRRQDGAAPNAGRSD